MAQVDWLMEYESFLHAGESCVSIVTSGDIDAVVIHMFALAYKWKRTTNTGFLHDVYVALQCTVDSRYLELGYLEFCKTRSVYLNQ